MPGITFGAHTGAFLDYVAGYAPVVLGYAAELERMYATPIDDSAQFVTATATLIVVQVPQPGYPPLLVSMAGSGFGEGPNGSVVGDVSMLTIQQGGVTLVTFGIAASRLTFTSGDVVVTLDGSFPTSLGAISDLLDGAAGAGFGVTGIHVSKAGVSHLDATFTAGAVVVDLGAYTITAEGTFPSTLAAAALLAPLVEGAGDAGTIRSLTVRHDASGQIAQQILFGAGGLSLAAFLGAADGGGAGAVLNAAFGTGEPVTFDAASSDVPLLLDLRVGGTLGLATQLLGTLVSPAALKFGVIQGSGFDDRVYANASVSTMIAGGLGADVLVGNAGADTLVGEDGGDYLFGEGGRDSLAGGDGDDQLDGGAGDDTLNGDAGSDTLVGGDGNDSLVGGGGRNVLVGGIGNDTLVAGPAGDALVGGAGNDSIRGGAGNDTVLEFNDPSGANSIDGGAGDDLIYGGDGADAITAGTGADVVYGGAGDDVIDDSADTGAAVDVLVGDAGDDTVRGSNGAGAGLDDLIIGGAGHDMLAGNAGHDWIFGDGAAGEGSDTLDGGAGDDTLEGNGGDDSLVGGAGFDVIYGGAGHDVIDESADTGAQSNVLLGEGGNDEIHGSNGQDPVSGIGDLIMGGDGDDRLMGLGGNDIIYGDNADGTGSGADSIDGGAGSDIIYAGDGGDRIAGSEGFDVVYGGAGSDSVDYGGAADSVVLVGEADNDTLIGGLGADFLAGGDGNDLLRGSAGADTLALGGGRDLVLFGGTGDGTDQILDFTTGTDMDDYFGFLLSGFAGVAITGARAFDTGYVTPFANSTFVAGSVATLGSGSNAAAQVVVVWDQLFAGSSEALAAVNAGWGANVADNGTIVVYRAGADNFRLSYDSNGALDGGETFLAALGGITDANISTLDNSAFNFWL